MTAKTPNIRYIVAKTHLPQFMRFLKQQMSPFYPFRGGGVAKRGKCHLFLELFVQYTSLISGLISKKSFFPGAGVSLTR